MSEVRTLARIMIQAAFVNAEAVAEDQSVVRGLVEASIRRAYDVAIEAIQTYEDRGPAEAVKRIGDAILDDAGLLGP